MSELTKLAEKLLNNEITEEEFLKILDKIKQMKTGNLEGIAEQGLELDEEADSTEKEL